MKTVIFTWTHKVCNLVTNLENTGINMWGLGDLIRGTVACYQICKKHNYNMIVDIQLHQLSKYFCFEKHKYSDKVIEYENNIEFIFPHTLENFLINNKNDEIYIVSNEFYNEPITDDCKDFIKNILKPNEELKQYIDMKLKEIPYEHYSVIHIRVLDDYDTKYVNDNDLDNLCNLFLKNKTNNTVLITNSKILKCFIKHKTSDYFSFDTHSEHIGKGNGNIIHLKDTLLEFFVLLNSVEIKSFTQYGWISGFSSIAFMIYNIPFVGHNNVPFIGYDNIRHPHH